MFKILRQVRVKLVHNSRLKYPRAKNEENWQAAFRSESNCNAEHRGRNIHEDDAGSPCGMWLVACGLFEYSSFPFTFCPSPWSSFSGQTFALGFEGCCGLRERVRIASASAIVGEIADESGGIARLKFVVVRLASASLALF